MNREAVENATKAGQVCGHALIESGGPTSMWWHELDPGDLTSYDVLVAWLPTKTAPLAVAVMNGSFQTSYRFDIENRYDDGYVAHRLAGGNYPSGAVLAAFVNAVCAVLRNQLGVEVS